MDFFIPQIADPAKAEEVWQSVKSFMEMQGQSVTDRRIFRLDYVHNGKEWEAEVGEPHPYGHPTTWEYVPDYDDPKAGEWVVAILEAEVVTTSSARTIAGSSAANRSCRRQRAPEGHLLQSLRPRRLRERAVRRTDQ